MSQLKRPISSLRPIPEICQEIILAKECPCDKVIEQNPCENVQIVSRPVETNICESSATIVTAPGTVVVETKKQKNKSKRWSKVASFIFWLIVLTIVFWLVFYSLVPPFVMKTGTTEPDLTKVLLAAFIFSFVILIFVWAFYYCIN